MNRIDVYIKNFVSNRAAGLILQGGQSAQLKFADGPPKPMKKTCTEEEILALVKDVMDEETTAAFERSGKAAVTYDADALGTVSIAVDRLSSGVRCELTLEPAGVKKTPPPAKAVPAVPAPPSGKPAPAVQAPAPSFGKPSSVVATQADGAAAPRKPSSGIVLMPRQAETVEHDVAPRQDPAGSMGYAHALPSQPISMTAAVSADGQDIGMYRWLRRMAQEKASDLFLLSDEVPAMRSSGQLAPVGSEPVGRALVEQWLQQVLGTVHYQALLTDHALDVVVALSGVGRFRLHCYLDRRGPAMAARMIPELVGMLDDLAAPPPVRQLCSQTRGLVLLAGPRGSGRSTTMAAMVEHINNTREGHIVTLDSPLEFLHKNRKCVVTQREVGTHTRSFADGLRAAMRELPDVIAVGALRDQETVALALEAADAGHLVIGTVNTGTTAGAVERLIDMFPRERQGQGRNLLASTLRGVVAQVLCAKKQRGTGTVAAFEVLLGTMSASNVIREGRVFQLEGVIANGKREGMVSLNESLMALVDASTITPQEAYARSLDRAEMRTLLTKVNYKPAEGDWSW